MNNQNNYYNTLNVDKQSTAEEIKKQFRKLSMKYHPDKNHNSKESESIFQRISEAYDTLGDANKRKEYDYNLGFGFGSGSFEPKESDIFNMFFNPSKSRSTHVQKASIPIPPSLFGMFNLGSMNMNDMPVKMTQMDNLFADQIEQELKNMFISGSTNNNFNHETSFKKEVESEIKPSTLHITLDIDILQSYTGCSLPVEIDREIWHDSSIREKDKETIYIDIPKGIDTNEVITIKEKGHINNYNKTGDVKIHINVKNNTEFVRSGIDLIFHKSITLKESLCGFNFEFTHITGKTYRINNKSGNIISPEFKKKIDKLGMKRDNHTGNLIILFHVKYPETLSSEQLQQIEKILE